jgi:predicted RNase H-like nuclease
MEQLVTPGVIYVGLDLAWGERARSGLAVLNEAGRLVESASVRSDEEIASFIDQHKSRTLVAAIDAPLVVPNQYGRRPCEALVSELFGRYRAGAYPANRGNPIFFPEPRGARLATRFGWDVDPSVRPAAGRSVAIEVYPHPAMVSLFSLELVIPYKGKRGRDIDGLKAAYEALFTNMEATCGELLALRSSGQWSALRSVAAAATRKFELEAIEDEIDAIFCAYLAWLWTTSNETMMVLGDFATGYIVTPAVPDAARYRLGLTASLAAGPAPAPVTARTSMR